MNAAIKNIPSIASPPNGGSTGRHNMDYYYVIFSDTSRNSTTGLRPRVKLATREDIITDAAADMQRSGQTLEDLAGIGWVENADGDLTPEREMLPDEALRYSLQALADDGRMYEIYPRTLEGNEEFLEAADIHGVTDAAQALL